MRPLPDRVVATGDQEILLYCDIRAGSFIGLLLKPSSAAYPPSSGKFGLQS